MDEIVDARQQFFDLLKTEDTIGHAAFTIRLEGSEPNRGLCKIARPKKKGSSVPYLNFTFMVDYLSGKEEDAVRAAFSLLRKKLSKKIPLNIDVIETFVGSSAPGMVMSQMDVLFDQGTEVDPRQIEEVFLPAFESIVPVHVEAITWVTDIADRKA